MRLEAAVKFRQLKRVSIWIDVEKNAGIWYTTNQQKVLPFTVGGSPSPEGL